MKRKIIIALVTITGIMMFSGIGVQASASTLKPDDINSQGKIVFDNDTEETADDVIFDATDIYYLYSICK